MNEFKKDIQEDAKSDWMSLVNKHKKKQKGLPALSTLNTDAGNVEHNIEMFNMMQPNSIPSVDSSNGNTVSSEGCCESYHLQESHDQDVVVLDYENIPVEVVTRRGNSSGYYSSSFGNWLPDEDDTTEILIDWEYEVDKQDIIEYLQDHDEIFVTLDIDPEVDDDSLNNAIIENFDNLLEKFEADIKEYFYDSAVSNAQENYDYEEDYPDYEPYEESLSSMKDSIEFDDNFDMSMRTLL
jgi:hypothetical protein